MYAKTIPFARFSSYHLHVALMEYQYESISFYICVLFNFHIDELELRGRLPFGILSRGATVIVDKNTQMRFRQIHFRCAQQMRFIVTNHNRFT